MGTVGEHITFCTSNKALEYIQYTHHRWLSESADPVGMGRESCLYTILSSSTFCPCQLDQLIVFASIPLLSILRPILNSYPKNNDHANAKKGMRSRPP